MDGLAFEFHIAREARNRYGFADRLFSVTGNVVVADLAASRDLAHRMNAVRDAAHHPELTVNPAALNAMGLLDEVSHIILAQYRVRRDPRALLDALGWFEARLTRHTLDTTLLSFAERFPTAFHPVRNPFNQLIGADPWLAEQPMRSSGVAQASRLEFGPAKLGRLTQ